PLSFPAVLIRAIEHGKALALQVGCAFYRHRSADEVVCLFNLLLRKTKGFEQAPFEIKILFGAESKSLQAFFSEGIYVEYETDLKSRSHSRIQFPDLFGDEPFFAQGLVVDVRCA